MSAHLCVCVCARVRVCVCVCVWGVCLCVRARGASVCAYKHVGGGEKGPQSTLEENKKRVIVPDSGIPHDSVMEESET